MEIRVAPGVAEDSWLHRGDDEFERFKVGYAYARNQTMAIPSLAKVTPEDAYRIWSAIQRGIDRHEEADHSPAGGGRRDHRESGDLGDHPWYFRDRGGDLRCAMCRRQADDPACTCEW